MTRAKRAVIVGAGLAGLATALRLRQIGWDALVVERASARRRGGYLMHLSGDGYDAAGRLGLLPALRERHFDGFDLVDVSPKGRPRFTIPSAAVQAMLGARNLFLLRGDVEDVLYTAVAGAVPVRFGTSVTTVRQDGRGVRVGLTDGNEERADLLIGADGRHSLVRELVFGPEERYDSPSEHVLAAFEVPYVPDGLRVGTVTQLAMIGRRVTMLTLPRTRCVLLLYRSADPKGDVADGPAKALDRAFGDLGWIIPDLLDRIRATESVYFDNPAPIGMDAWVRGSVALVGDAAWALPPSTGLGGSQAVAGVERLGTALEARPDDVPGALADWQTELRPVVERRRRRGLQGQRRVLPATRLGLARGNLQQRMVALPAVSHLLALSAAPHRE